MGLYETKTLKYANKLTGEERFSVELKNGFGIQIKKDDESETFYTTFPLLFAYMDSEGLSKLHTYLSVFEAIPDFSFMVHSQVFCSINMSNSSSVTEVRPPLPSLQELGKEIEKQRKKEARKASIKRLYRYFDDFTDKARKHQLEGDLLLTEIEALSEKIKGEILGLKE